MQRRSIILEKFRNVLEIKRNSSKSLTKPLQQEQYPDSDSLKDLADAFGDFFIMKIQKIRTKLDSQDPEPITIPRVPVKEEDIFLSFQPLTEDDVRKLIKQSPNKQQ